jgi:hypothetical protein
VKIAAFALLTFHLGWSWTLPVLAAIFMALAVVIRFRAARAIRRVAADGANARYLPIAIEAQSYEVLDATVTLPIIAIAVAIALGLAQKTFGATNISGADNPRGWIDLIISSLPFLIAALVSADLLRKWGLLRMFRQLSLSNGSASVPEIDKAKAVYESRFG